MKIIKLFEAKAIFRAAGHDVGDLTPCCRATVWKGCCPACGQPVVMPFYFLSLKPVMDEFLIDQETRLRAAYPVGTELACYIP